MVLDKRLPSVSEARIELRAAKGGPLHSALLLAGAELNDVLLCCGSRLGYLPEGVTMLKTTEGVAMLTTTESAAMLKTSEGCGGDLSTTDSRLEQGLTRTGATHTQDSDEFADGPSPQQKGLATHTGATHTQDSKEFDGPPLLAESLVTAGGGHTGVREELLQIRIFGLARPPAGIAMPPTVPPAGIGAPGATQPPAGISQPPVGIGAPAADQPPAGISRPHEAQPPAGISRPEEPIGKCPRCWRHVHGRALSGEGVTLEDGWTYRGCPTGGAPGLCYASG